MKKCERAGCDAEAQFRKRFCKKCEKLVKEEMKSMGYLAPEPRQGDGRTSDMKEDTYSTKHGHNR
jgi:hypothetical protein